MKRGGFPKRGLWTSVLAITAVLLSVSPGLAQSRVAILTPGPELSFDPVLKGLREGLAKLGYAEGKQVTFIVDKTEGGSPDLVIRVAKLLEAKPDVLFTVTPASTAAAKQATATVPIVFTLVGDPVGLGLVASYTSSKNNLTGVGTAILTTAGKRLEILKEIAPGLKRVLAIVSAKEIIAETMVQVVDETAKKLGIQVLRRDVTSKEEIEKVLSGTPQGSVDAIYYVPSVLVGSRVGLLITKAKQDRIPLVVHESYLVEKGALVSYGADHRLMGIQAANLIAKILKGFKPSDIPIQTPGRYFLTVNLTTAKTIGLKIPRGVLERTDGLVE